MKMKTKYLILLVGGEKNFTNLSFIILSNPDRYVGLRSIRKFARSLFFFASAFFIFFSYALISLHFSKSGSWWRKEMSFKW